MKSFMSPTPQPARENAPFLVPTDVHRALEKHELCGLEQVFFPMPQFTQREILSFMAYRYSRKEPRDRH